MVEETRQPGASVPEVAQRYGVNGGVYFSSVCLTGEPSPAPEGGELCDAAFGALIDDMHEAQIKRAGIGYLDPVQNRIATQHGFRSTFRDWAAEVALFPREVIEHALAHKLKDEAGAAYQRGDFLLKRAVVMERWAQFSNEASPELPDIAKLLEKKAMTC